MSATMINSGQVAFLQGESYPVGSLGQRLANSVSLTDAPFNAKCDGVTDDTAAVQAAINFCLAFSEPAAIRVPGQCKISPNTLIIDRPVDESKSSFVFFGEGPGAGFKLTTSGAMFDSSIISPDGRPVSEFTTFQNITFTCSDPSLAAFVLTKKFLRMTFNSCRFQALKIGDFELNGDAVGYAQSYMFINCSAFGWQGDLFHAFQFYDLLVLAGLYENGASGFTSIGTFGANINAARESLSGYFFDTTSGRGIEVAGYNEGMSTGDCRFSSGGGTTFGVTHFAQCFLIGAQLSDPTYYPIVVGDVRGFNGNGFATKNLYDDTTTNAGELTWLGSTPEVMGGNLTKTGRSCRVFPSGPATSDPEITALGTNAATAYQLFAQVSIIIDGAANTGVVLPSATTAYCPTGFGRPLTICNPDNIPHPVYGSGSDLIDGAASFLMPPGSKFDFVAGEPGLWRLYARVLPARANLSGGATLADVIAFTNTLVQDMRDIALMRV